MLSTVLPGMLGLPWPNSLCFGTQPSPLDWPPSLFQAPPPSSCSPLVPTAFFYGVVYLTVGVHMSPFPTTCELHEGKDPALLVPQPPQKRGSPCWMNEWTMNPTESVEFSFCMGQVVAAILTVERGVYNVECIVIEDGFHQIHLEQRRGQSKGIK